MLHSGILHFKRFVMLAKLVGCLTLATAVSASCQVLAQSPGTSQDTRQLAADNRELSDEVVQLAIEKELLASQAVDSRDIEVRVVDGIVTLSGNISHLLAEDVAIGLAQRIRGVVSVVDLIEVNALRRPDDDLKRDVLTAMASDPATHDWSPEVSVASGVVTLSGIVPTHGEKILLERIAKGVLGVFSIKNELRVAQRAAISDELLGKEINELLQYTVLLDDASIDVQVEASQVVLNGTVSSAYQRSQAEQLAWQAGATAVDGRGIEISWRHSDRMLRQKRYEQATDPEIRSAIERAWSYDPRLVGFEPKLEVEHGIVTLSGTVEDIPAKQAAERIAKYTIGVRDVKNLLEVHWPDETPTDEQIVASTHEALRRDPYVDVENLRIDCENAHVGLYGVVESEFEKEHAQWTAGHQVGVVHVDNSLNVRGKWVTKSDAAIQADLNDRLSYTFVDPDNQVTGKVEDGVALLEGTVDSWFMWQTAVDQALAAGAREPHAMIEVRYTSATGAPYYGPQYYIPR